MHFCVFAVWLESNPVQLNWEVAGLISRATIICQFQARRRAVIRWIYCPATVSVTTGTASLPLAASQGLQGAAGWPSGASGNRSRSLAHSVLQKTETERRNEEKCENKNPTPTRDYQHNGFCETAYFVPRTSSEQKRNRRLPITVRRLVTKS